MFALSTLLIFLLCSSSDIVVANDAQLYELTSETIPKLSQGLWLLEFYATWCPHCHNLEPIIREVTVILHDLHPNVKVMKVDAPQNSQLASQFGVKGYPTLIFLKDGVKFEYKEDRTSNKLVSFVSRICGPAVEHLKNEDQLNVRLKEHDGSAIFVYISSSHGVIWNAFNIVAEENKMRLSFFAMQSPNVPETVFVYKDDTKVAFDSPEGLVASDDDVASKLRAWVDQEQCPAFPQLTMLGIRRMEAEMAEARRLHEQSPEQSGGANVRRPRTLVVFVLGQDAASERLKSFGKALSLDSVSPLQESFKFAWTYDTVGINRVAMTAIATPNLFFYGSDEEYILHPKYADENGLRDLSHESLMAFLGDVAADRVAPYGGKGFCASVKRFFYELLTGCIELIATSPMVALVVFACPLACLACLFYCICCGTFEEDDDEEVFLYNRRLSKQPQTEYSSLETLGATQMQMNTVARSKFKSSTATVIGPVPSAEEIALKRSAYLEGKKDK